MNTCKKIFHKYSVVLLSLLPIWAAIAAWLLYLAFGHDLVTQAYNGNSPVAAFNHAISGQALFPLAHFIDYADVIVWRSLLMAVVASYMTIVFGYGILYAALLLLTGKNSDKCKIFLQHSKKTIPVIVMCAGITVLLIVMWSYTKYSTNIPYQDDFHTSLELVMNFDDAPSITERVSILLRRHSSHILVVPNLANIIDWKLFGTLNLRHMVLVAFAFLLAMIVLLQIQIKGQHRDIHAITVALLCINILTYAGTLWPVTALQNYSVLALTAAALLLLSKQGNARFCLAALMITLATFSSGNGMFGFIAGAAVLAIRNKKKLFLGWSAWGILVVIIFFQIFEKNKGYKVVTGLGQGLETLVAYYLAFTGSIIQVIPYCSRFAPLVGVVLLALCVFLFQQNYHRKNPAIAGWILFMLITAGVVTLGRCGNPYSGPLESRYAINSCVLVALIFSALVELYGHYFNRLHAAIFCFMALLFNAFTLHYYLPAMIDRNERLVAGAQRYITQADPAGLASMHPDHAEMVLTEAARRNVYNIAAGLYLDPPYKIPPAKILGVVPPTSP